MKIKKQTIACWIIIIQFLVYSLMYTPLQSNRILQILNGNFMQLTIVLFAVLIVTGMKNGKITIIFGKELMRGFLMLFILLVISLIYIVINHQNNENLVSGLETMLFPLLVVIGLMNISDFHQINNMMKIILWISIIGYIIEIGTKTFTISELLTISIGESYSPFESHVFSGIAAGLAGYFCYFRKEKKYMIISVIFSLITFKRIPLLFTVILFVYSLFSIKKDEPIKKKTLFITIIVFCVAGVLYTQSMIPANISALNDIVEKYFSVDISQFTMGRNTLFDALLERGFVRIGLDSTFLFSKDIEMDLVRLYMEVGIIGLVSVVTFFWSLVERKRYVYLFMMSIFVNLLFSHSIHSTMGWIIKYIVIFSVSMYDSKCDAAKLPRVFEKRLRRAK